jgi:hypothetical protein
MRFENYLIEKNIRLDALASELLEGYEPETLKKKRRLLAALALFVGEIFDNRDMVQSGLEALTSKELS